MHRKEHKEHRFEKEVVEMFAGYLGPQGKFCLGSSNLASQTGRVGEGSESCRRM